MWSYMYVSSVVLLFSLLYHYQFKKPISIVENPETNYDYIVVGAGTAGCVIASRLSESPDITVLLVEAGGHFGWFSSIPLAAPLMQGKTVDWAYKTEPQSFSSKGLHNQSQSLPRGKGLGGSGQINYLVHSFGTPEDYNDWPKGWTQEDMWPYFGKVQETMNVDVVSPDEKLAAAFAKAETEMSKRDVSLVLAKNTLKSGARWSSYHAYLQPALNRKNLHILTNTVVTRVVFENYDARGVELSHQNGNHRIIAARKEIILCGGAINTPQLMMLSGIGPVEELEKHNIPVVKGLEYVGKNLYDHLNVPIYVNLRAAVSITLSKMRSVTEILTYLMFGNGLLASNAIMGTGRTDNSGIVLFGMGSADEALLKDIANFRNKTFRELFPSHADTEQEGFIYLASCLQPRSRGNITLTSRNISDPPKIDPRYLQNYFDVSCTQKAIDLALYTLNTKPFLDIGAKAHIPRLRECRDWKQDWRNRDYSECVMRTGGLTGHHPGGTCKMGSGEDAVVDEFLRVKDVNGLRIMDASVLPSPISGTPNSVIIAMAERAADLILNQKTK